MAWKPQPKIAAERTAPSGETVSSNRIPASAAESKPGSARARPAPDIGPGTLVVLGLDVHARQITVVRQIDHSLPQPAQRMEEAALLPWVEKMVHLGAQVLSCYEAGCFGYVLHRRLTELGVENVVVAPEAWSGAVKTDKRDARELCLRRERYHAGNTRALSVVRVPTVEEEARRSAGRQRERLLKERIRAERRGASLLLLAGIKTPKGWWEEAAWKELSAGLPALLRREAGLWQEQALHYEALQAAAKEELEKESAAEQSSLPNGLGHLTWRLLSGEILTWARFKNRREVGSYTGLCPGEHSSGDSRQSGPMTRHGNPRVRTLLIEAVWRLSRYEPGWRGFKKFPALLDKKAGSRRRRKAVAAAARLLAIDLWRLATGQTTTAKLGLSREFRRQEPATAASAAAPPG
jgi:transposase